MKPEILERYERDKAGNIIIAVSVAQIEDLFDNYDKQSHFLKKDLDDDLTEYLAACVNEIGAEPFILRFSFEKAVDASAIERLRGSISRFFRYKQQRELEKRSDMIRTSSILLLIGLGFATLSVMLSQNKDAGVVVGVIVEGLTVAAWVSLWEALATFLIKWMPIRKRLLLYERIATCAIETAQNEHRY